MPHRLEWSRPDITEAGASDHQAPLAESQGNNQYRFALPPEVSFHKQRLGDGWAYLFWHRLLGELGRILVQDT